MTTTPGLETTSTDNQGRTWYEPLVLRVARASKYNNASKPIAQHEWQFDSLPDYWTCQSLYLTVNQWYKLEFTTKSKDGSDGLWRDIKRARLATPDEIPAQQPATSASEPQSSPQSRPVRPDGGGIFRTKEELRYTEAYHMATRIVGIPMGDQTASQDDIQEFIVSWANWFYNELAVAGSSATQEPEAGNPAHINMEEPETPPPTDKPKDELPF